MQMVRRWRQLDAKRRALLLRVIARGILYRAAILLLPWATVAKHRPRVASVAQGGAFADVQWAVKVGQERLQKLSCLSLAFAARDELARCGIAATIDIGAIADAAGTRFHAVARVGGATIGTPQDMVVLMSLGETVDNPMSDDGGVVAARARGLRRLFRRRTQ